MNLPTEILIDTEISENATATRHTNNARVASDKEALRTELPIAILLTNLTTEQILKEKGTISVQNMAKAVAAARA
jgi:hypothetical protein